MLVPIGVPLALGVAGWFAGGWPGAVAAGAIGVFLNVAVVASAAVWARQIGSILDRDEAFAVAPRPPGFGRLCDWVYKRTL